MATFNLSASKEAINAALLDVINKDTIPTEASTRMVQSGGVKSYLDSFVSALSSTSSGLAARITSLEASKLGWVRYVGSAYTTSNRLSANSARAQITIDGLGVGTVLDYSALSSGSFWAANQMTPLSIGDTYLVRIDFKAQAAASDSWFDLELDISPTKDGSNVILLDTVPMTKGTLEMHITRTYAIEAMDAFVANNGAFFINTSESADSLSIYDISIFINRLSSFD